MPPPRNQDPDYDPTWEREQPRRPGVGQNYGGGGSASNVGGAGPASPMSPAQRALYQRAYLTGTTGRAQGQRPPSEDDRITEAIWRFYEEMNKPLDTSDPRVQRMIKAAQSAMQWNMNRRGIQGTGFSVLNSEMAAQDRLFDEQARREGLALQGLGLSSQRDIGLRGIEAQLAALQQQKARDAYNQRMDAYGNDLMGGQAIGAGIGGVAGGLLGGAIGSVVPGVGTAIGAGLGVAGGSMIGGGIGGLISGGGSRYKPDPYGSGY